MAVAVDSATILCMAEYCSGALAIGKAIAHYPTVRIMNAWKESDAAGLGAAQRLQRPILAVR